VVLAGHRALCVAIDQDDDKAPLYQTARAARARHVPYDHAVADSKRCSRPTRPPIHSSPPRLGRRLQPSATRLLGTMTLLLRPPPQPSVSHRSRCFVRWCAVLRLATTIQDNPRASCSCPAVNHYCRIISALKIQEADPSFEAG
jgi:hypothetical protein